MRPRPRRCIASSPCWGEQGADMHALRRSFEYAGLRVGRRSHVGRPAPPRSRRLPVDRACGRWPALALATWSVQDPSLSHATSAPVRNLLGAPGADRGRPDDAASRDCRAGPDPADRDLGMAAGVAPAARPRDGCGSCCGSPARCLPPPSRRACRSQPTGRCRPGSAASSATRCCGSRPLCWADRWPAPAASSLRSWSAASRCSRS